MENNINAEAVKRVRDAIEIGLISTDDVIHYIESLDDLIVVSKSRYEMLEESFINHPG